MRPLAVALLCALLGGGAYAKDAEECIAAAGVGAPDFAMPRVAAAIAKKQLDIAVIGSASSELAGPSGTNIAYPTRLQVALSKLLARRRRQGDDLRPPARNRGGDGEKALADRRRGEARPGGLADRHGGRDPRRRSRTTSASPSTTASPPCSRPASISCS